MAPTLLLLPSTEAGTCLSPLGPSSPHSGPLGAVSAHPAQESHPRRGLTSSKAWKVKPGTAAGSGLHWPEATAATAATATRPGPGRPPHPDPGIAIVLPSPRPPGSLPVTTHMHTCTHIHACAQCTCTCAHAHGHTQPRACAGMLTGTHTCAHVHMHAAVHAHGRTHPFSKTANYCC